MKSFTTRNNLPEPTRMAMVNLLQPILADLIVLGTQVKQAHWNVKGSSFLPVHKFMDDLYEESEEWVDTVAERIAQLGFQTMGTAAMAAKATSLPDLPMETYECMAVLGAIADRVAMVANCVRHCCGQMGDDLTTQNVMLNIAEALDKQLWFVEAHLQG